LRRRLGGDLIGLDPDHVAAVEIGDRQWNAAAPVAEEEPSLVIGAPHMVGAFRVRQRTTLSRIDTRAAALWFGKPVSLEDFSNRTPCRGHPDPAVAKKQLVELLRSPGWGAGGARQ